MAELKPCPFCGGKPIIKNFLVFKRQHKMRTKFYVTCPSCDIDGPGTHLNEDEAIAAWNRRAGEDG